MERPKSHVDAPRRPSGCLTPSPVAAGGGVPFLTRIPYQSYLGFPSKCRKSLKNKSEDDGTRTRNHRIDSRVDCPSGIRRNTLVIGPASLSSDYDGFSDTSLPQMRLSAASVKEFPQPLFVRCGGQLTRSCNDFGYCLPVRSSDQNWCRSGQGRLSRSRRYCRYRTLPGKQRCSR